jgi:NAD-dependent SIR2 family protein deacetylase
MKFTNKIAEIEKERKQEQKEITQNIDHFKKKIEQINENFTTIELTQEIHSSKINQSIKEFELVNQRIVQVYFCLTFLG